MYDFVPFLVNYEPWLNFFFSIILRRQHIYVMAEVLHVLGQ